MDKDLRPRSHRHARKRMLRVALLALTLALANLLAPWSMAFASGHAEQAMSHHCHDDGSAKKPLHGSACPCCDSGCHCMSGTAAPLPMFPSIRALTPDTVIVQRDGSAPANPPIAEHLRPPIA